MTPDALEGLNVAQLKAATAVRGPVCILAGAGSGKTTTITRRIAHQIASGAFRAREILAVTFTDRAAHEMRSRLEGLGAAGVRARTFHAEALAQVAHFRGSPELMASKAQLIGPLVRRLPAPYKFRPTKDVAAEIERAKNRRVAPARYLDDLGDHDPPLPPDLMVRVYGEYETRKRRAGKLDFEDLLEEAIVLLEDGGDAAAAIRDRYRAFTVDEYQDVNLLQQTLLEGWLGPRRDVCVVGDDYQSIFGFTGATPRYLLEFPSRHPGTTVVTLEDNYRSTAQVLEVANRLVPRLGGAAKTLRATRPPGAEPSIACCADETDEIERIVAGIRKLAAAGVPFEQMAVLYRINARSEDFEEALSRDGIPFQVRDAVFLRRPGPRAVMHRLRRLDPGTPAGPAVRAAALEVGWAPDAEPEEADGIEEVTRQADLARLVRLAESAPSSRLDAFLADLRARFTDEGEGRGVVLSTYHRAKGLEWDAVFLPRLEERELPFALAKGDAEVAEERRLLYVGITRARVHLSVTWAAVRDGKRARPSRFVEELLPRAPRPPAAGRPSTAPADGDLFARLRDWRRRVAESTSVPPYVVFHDATLREICDRRPKTLVELGLVSGVGPTKLARYGAEVLEVVGASDG